MGSAARIAFAFAILGAQELAPDGEFRFRRSGDLSGLEIGASRFEGGEELFDGEPAFIVALFTSAIEGGFYLVRSGTDRPEPGAYNVARAEVGGSGDFDDFEPSEEFAVLYFEMDPQNLVALGSTGAGTIDIVQSREDLLRGRFELVVEGFSGNPRGLFSMRQRRVTVSGNFAATPGDVDFRLP